MTIYLLSLLLSCTMLIGTQAEACPSGQYSADGDDTSCINCGTLVGAATTTCTTGNDQVAATCKNGWSLSENTWEGCSTYVEVFIDQVGGPPTMPVESTGDYTPDMIVDAISLRAWPPTDVNRASNPTVTVLKILSAFSPAQVEDNCVSGCFDVSLQSGDTEMFEIRESGGWILLFQGARDTGNSEGYYKNSWSVVIEVSLNSGATVQSRLITLAVSAPVNVPGCIDATALNHNPNANANTDDDSCEFCFQVPNSEAYTCDATGASGIQSVTCSPFYLETGAAGVNLGCTLTCEAAEQEWLADCACTVDSVDCVAKKNAWTNAGCASQTCG
tara:strand:+ start:309 stop:1301 length:993 start_codon:yes stop_codon:yes gene_type:complete